MIKKKRKRVKLERLTGALQELLSDVEDTITLTNQGRHRQSTQAGYNGITYIMSKENQPIPKLSDTEVMERHRRADENMKSTWMNIIKKYEEVEHQGDVIDLATEEIVEDNGHIRNMSAAAKGSADLPKDTKTTYSSVLSDILDIEEENGNVWNSVDSEENDSADEPCKNSEMKRKFFD